MIASEHHALLEFYLSAGDSSKFLHWNVFPSSSAATALLSHSIHSLKARSHHPILRIRFFVPKIGGRRSDRPISSLCFCRHLSSFKKSVGRKKNMFYFHPFSQNYGSVCQSVIFTVFTRSDFRNFRPPPPPPQPPGAHMIKPSIKFCVCKYLVLICHSDI